MAATVELTKRTALEEMIIRNNKSEKQQMIDSKTKGNERSFRKCRILCEHQKQRIRR